MTGFSHKLTAALTAAAMLGGTLSVLPGTVSAEIDTVLFDA
jgi:hypothetical protein